METPLQQTGAMVQGSGWDDKPLPKRTGPKGLLPSTWLNRELRLEYQDADGRAQATVGILLDRHPAGPVLNIDGPKTLLSWGCIRLVELVND